MKKIFFVIALTAILTFVGGLSHAQEVINGPDWELDKKFNYSQDLGLKIDLYIKKYPWFSFPLKMYIESTDNGIYTVTGTNKLCSVSSFTKCNYIDTGYNDNLHVNSNTSYLDLTGVEVIFPYDSPNDISPLRDSPDYNPKVTQLWEVYDYPFPDSEEWMDLATSRKTYSIDYFIIEFQCTPSQGKWDLRLIDDTLFCTKSEAKNYVWKPMGTWSMRIYFELKLINPRLPLPFDFPIYDTKSQFVQNNTSIQLITSINLPFSDLGIGPIEGDETRYYDLKIDYDDAGYCFNDERVKLTTTATNENDPNDILKFNQLYSEHVQYVYGQKIKGIDVNVSRNSDITGNLSFEKLDSNLRMPLICGRWEKLE